MYTLKDFSHLTTSGIFSETLMQNHLTLYKGYVDNANKCITLLDEVEKGSYQYGELKRRLGWEVDGIKLHELFFENLAKDGGEPGEKTTELLVKSYGSIDAWKESLKRNALTRGIGWVALVHDKDTGATFHTWIGEHNVGNLVGTHTLMMLDMWEHAFLTDYGIKKADYITVFLSVINWGVVEKRVIAAGL